MANHRHIYTTITRYNFKKTSLTFIPIATNMSRFVKEELAFVLACAMVPGVEIHMQNPVCFLAIVLEIKLSHH